jgi:hypothetical protein
MRVRDASARESKATTWEGGASVLAKANEYRGAATGELPAAPEGVPPATESMRAILANHRITLTPIQRTDVRSGVLDPRLLAALVWTGERHAVVITALKSDHPLHGRGQRLQPRGGPADGHRRGRRRGLPRHAHRQLRRPGARVRGDDRAAAFDRAHLLLGPGSGRRIRVASRAQIIATTSIGGWMVDAGRCAASPDRGPNADACSARCGPFRRELAQPHSEESSMPRRWLYSATPPLSGCRPVGLATLRRVRGPHACERGSPHAGARRLV